MCGRYREPLSPFLVREGGWGLGWEGSIAMLFVLLVNYTRPYEEVERLFPEHRAYLRRAFEAGMFVVSGVRSPAAVGGLILARAESEEAIRATTAEDPFVRAGVAEYAILPFSPLWYAPAFAPFLPMDTQARPLPPAPDAR